tara:strand:+ start:139 stop:489 length:351 start_codon:yes stop_codon:yes gene_type:complete
MTKDEALKLAQDALEGYVNVVVSVNDPYEWTPKVADAGEPARKAITAIKAALEIEPDFGPQPGMHHGMNQDDWKDIVAAISKARDSRGIYLACRPADVFQDWFLAMGLFKPKEKNA